MRKNELNYKFLMLQSIGIILIVLGHSGGISILTDWFPTDSFSVPLFIFISGYFFKKESENDILSYIKHKFIKLIIPLYIWNLLYGILITMLLNNNIVEYGNKISFRTYFIEPWISGNQFAINASSWFITTLFLVQILYIVSRKVFLKININNEYIITGIYCFLGLIAVYFANQKKVQNFDLLVVRCMFLMQFYQIGLLYKEKIEGKFNINNILYFVFLFSIQYILISGYKDTRFIVFDGTFGKAIWLPLISSLLGIMLWVKIASILYPLCIKSNVINYIGKNTFTVMMHHQLVFFIINIFLVNINKIIYLKDFQIELFRTNEWYKYNLNNNGLMLFYCFLGIFIPLIIKYKWKKTKLYIKIKNIISINYNNKFN